MTDRPAGESGITLVEVLVAMTLLSIAMAIFTPAMLEIYRSTSQTQALAGPQSQLNTAVSRLDREVRYAAEISPPGLGYGSEPRVEFLTTYTGTPVCTQLRLVADSTGAARLQRRSWTYVAGRAAGTPLTDLTGFTTLASDLKPGQPFRVAPTPTGTATPGVNAHRLTVELTAQSVAGGKPRTAVVTFTAMNSQIPQLQRNVCTEGRNIP